MDFWNVVERRHSVRSFDQNRDVPPEMVTRLLQAAIHAPSAGNCQPWFFFVVRNEDVKRALASAALNQRFLAEAPVVIVVCAEPERSARRYGDRGRHLYSVQDTAAATEHILLAAVASDLTACWVGAFDEEEASRALDLPSRLRPMAIIPLGYPAGPLPPRTNRRSLKEVTELVG